MMDDLDDLDDAVARALGGERDGDGWRFAPPLAIYSEEVSFIKSKRSFCREWEWGGPIIERERIDLTNLGEHGWLAFHNPQSGELWALRGEEGSTALIAAMRALVAAKQQNA